MNHDYTGSEIARAHGCPLPEEPKRPWLVIVLVVLVLAYCVARVAGWV